MVWLVPNRLPTGKKAEIRPWIGLINGVLYLGIRKVELECTGETSAVDSSDINCHHILGLVTRAGRMFLTAEVGGGR